jgi:hypothetical protein
LFSQKSNAHIGYLITAALAVIGVRDILNVHFNFFVLLAMFISIMIYFLGRTTYYSILIEAVMYIKTYTNDEFKTAHKDEYEKGKYSENYEFSQLYLLKRAASEFY